MSNDISFESDNNFKYKSRVIFGQAEVPKMTRFLIGKGLVKNEKQATTIMFTVTILLFIASFVLIYTSFFKESITPIYTPEEKLLLEESNITQ